jgi:predicted amidohydrolase
MHSYLAAVAQIDTSTPWGETMVRCEHFVDEAARQGAKLIAFPESFSQYLGRRTPAEPLENSPTLLRMADKARQHGMWILCGSVFTPSQEEARSFNTSVLLDPDGNQVAHYHKRHLFDVTLASGEVRRESLNICPGSENVTVQTQLGCIGMSVCYDLRFPEQFRAMALAGAQVFFVPAMFTTPTGRAHWEVLLRARAIENRCYVIAPDQIGGRFASYGHSMIVDPDGKILAQLEQDEEGLALAEIDLDHQALARQSIPSLDPSCSFHWGE